MEPLTRPWLTSPIHLVGVLPSPRNSDLAEESQASFAFQVDVAELPEHCSWQSIIRHGDLIRRDDIERAMGCTNRVDRRSLHRKVRLGHVCLKTK